MKVIIQVFVSWAGYVSLIGTSHRHACWAQGCPVQRIWSSVKLLCRHLSQRQMAVWLELVRINLHVKKTVGNISIQVKSHHSAFVGCFTHFSQCKVILRCQSPLKIEHWRNNAGSNLQWRSNIIERHNASISHYGIFSMHCVEWLKAHSIKFKSITVIKRNETRVGSVFAFISLHVFFKNDLYIVTPHSSLSETPMMLQKLFLSL